MLILAEDCRHIQPMILRSYKGRRLCLVKLYRYNPEQDNAPFMQDCPRLNFPKGKDLMVLGDVPMLAERKKRSPVLPAVIARRACAA